MDYWNNQERDSLSATTSNNRDAFERESSVYSAAPLMTGPMGPGPVITGPMVPMVPNVPMPLPFQFPLNPGTYPAYYQVPMAMPYPGRSFDAQGNAYEREQARFFPPPVPFYPRPYFYPPRPFFPPFLPPPFFPPFFI